MKKRIKSIFLIGVLTLLFVSVLMQYGGETLPFRDAKGDLIPNSIALEQDVIIGDVEQNLLIRGEDKNNPILLVLHGGPGSPYDAFAHSFQSELEKHFIVVNWTQRGAGKSYHFNIPNESMTLDQMLEDGNQVINHLCDTYQKEKVFLLGHSWGTALGTYLARDYPERIHAYIGAAQIVDMLEQEKVSYDFTISEAKQRNDEGAIEDLKEIGEPPYKDLVNGMQVKFQYFTQYEGYMDGMTDQSIMIDAFWNAPEYNILDILQFGFGMIYSMKTMLRNAGEDVWQISPRRFAYDLDVPVYIIQGRKDHLVDNDLVFDYFQKLKVPYKELILLDAGHMMFLEKPDEFCQKVIAIKENYLSRI